MNERRFNYWHIWATILWVSISAPLVSPIFDVMIGLERKCTVVWKGEGQ